MRTTDLSELAAFDAVARHRSFRRAAEERGVTASALSHAVSNLEARMGIRLLNRTTRSVSLTDAGAMLLSRLSPAFDDIGAAVDGVNQFRDSPFGKVRINIPNSIAPFVIGPVIGPLLAANPNLELEVVATDRLVDIVDEGVRRGRPAWREPQRRDDGREDQASPAARGGGLARLSRRARRAADPGGPRAACLPTEPLPERPPLRLVV
jgi:DNA-binding transcriptional LysR family regulator